jgi:hypothetical protein
MSLSPYTPSDARPTTYSKYTYLKRILSRSRVVFRTKPSSFRLARPAPEHSGCPRPSTMLAQQARPWWRLGAFLRLSREPQMRKLQSIAQAPRQRSPPVAATTPRHRKTEGRIAPRPTIDLDDPRVQSLMKKQHWHFRDSYQVTSHVQNELRKGNFEMALLFTRQASSKKQCVVAWNFLIQHLLSEQRLRAAIKLFNEVTEPCIGL